MIYHQLYFSTITTSRSTVVHYGSTRYPSRSTVNCFRSTRCNDGLLIRPQAHQSALKSPTNRRWSTTLVDFELTSRYPPGTLRGSQKNFPVPPRYSPGTLRGSQKIFPVPPRYPCRISEGFFGSPPGTPWGPARYPLEARPVPPGGPPGTPWCPARYPLVARSVSTGGPSVAIGSSSSSLRWPCSS